VKKVAEKKDLYKLLELSRDASPEDIKKAYRQMARKHHPDVNKDDPTATERFKEINNAYDILSDPQKRKMYDEYGHDAFDPTKGGGAGAGGFDFGGGTGFGGFGDIFDAFFGGFGGARQQNGPQRGADRETRIDISFEDGVFGMEKELELLRMEECEACEGTGAADKNKVKTCPQCNGSGQVRNVYNTPFGKMENIGTCNRCNGKGKVVEEPCKKCKGLGKIKKKRKISIKVPAGVDTGARLRVQGEGEEGSLGGPAGDLYIMIVVRGHHRFQRKGYNLVCEQEIDMVQAALGDEIELPLLRGEKIKLVIPEGAQPEQILTLNGKGVAHLNSNRMGDLKVILKVKIPRKLSKQQKELLQEFRKQEDKGKKGIIDKLKDAMG
jgi:molecular chaperone DnaJ